MTASMFLAGTILAGLLIAQLFRVYQADKEYKEELERYQKIVRSNGKTRKPNLPKK